MILKVPGLSLVVLVGASGSGKSSFARRHFKSTEVVSSDFCRGLVSDDENDQTASNDAFALLHTIVRTRLARGKLTVVDATNVELESRKQLVAIAKEYHAFAVAIVLDLPERICRERNLSRPDRQFGPHVIRRQVMNLHKSVRTLSKEGFRYVYTLDSPEMVEGAEVVRERLYNDRREEHGPFDIIGDIHGCYDELTALLQSLGWELGAEGVRHPAGRKAVFLGDLVDRGPKTPEVLELVMGMVAGGQAMAVPGNHDVKLMRKLRGRDVKLTHGLAESVAQLDTRPPEFRVRVADFVDNLVSHYVLDDGNLVVAHAGMKAEMQGRGSGRVREFALFGETTGETDEQGFPIRYNWAADYRGRATVVYGHTAVDEPEWLNGTICVDTGCVFGGKLTALRYPEKELVSVPAAQVYYEPSRPLTSIRRTHVHATAQQQQDDLLDVGDVLGKRIIATSLKENVTIREENAIAALEVMSRFAANPKWLVYLPPTMSPSGTSKREGLLEHPDEAFEYFREEGVARVVCQEKHMGSRAVVVVCRDEEAVRRRFGVEGEGIGIVYTRTGRRFFSESMPRLEGELLDHLRDALTRNGAWEAFSTDWFVLDCELMPWSVKAEELVRHQYASVGSVAMASLATALGALRAAAPRVEGVEALAAKFEERATMVERYIDAYRRYCWPVASLADVRLAPFHVLASEKGVHSDRDHVWHMESIGAMIQGSAGVLHATPYRVVDLADEVSVAGAVTWWEELTARGGEGMVVKPFDFAARSKRGLVQPAVKCRGAEYLRIIYGPEYSAPENLVRLRRRSLGGKRSLALREFALGIEALQRFVAREPLRRVHECVFGILALESEPVDPRL
jgi:protein phosphatase